MGYLFSDPIKLEKLISDTEIKKVVDLEKSQNLYDRKYKSVEYKTI